MASLRVQPVLASGRFLDEGSDLADDLTRSIAILDDTREGLA